MSVLISYFISFLFTFILVKLLKILINAMERFLKSCTLLL